MSDTYKFKRVEIRRVIEEACQDVIRDKKIAEQLYMKIMMPLEDFLSDCKYEPMTEPTRSKMEQVARDTNVRSKEPQTNDFQDWKDRMWAEAIVTEPQTEEAFPCDGCKWENEKWDRDNFAEHCDGCCKSDSHYEPKDEPQVSPSDCITCKHDLWSTPRTCGKCVRQEDEKPSMYEPKDEHSGEVTEMVEPQTDEEYINNLPWTEAGNGEQTDIEIARAIVHKMIDDAVIAEDAYPDLRQKMHDAVDNYEPQTERHLPDYSYEADLGRRIMEQTDCAWMKGEE